MTRQWPVNCPEKKLTMELFMHCCKQGVLAIYKGKPEFPQKLLEKSNFHRQNDWSGLWFGKPVLTFGKRPMKG